MSSKYEAYLPQAEDILKERHWLKDFALAKEVAKRNNIPQDSFYGLRSYLKRNLFDNNKFEEILRGGGFSEDNWSHGWLKTKEGTVYIRNEEDTIEIQDVFEDLKQQLDQYSPKIPKIKYPLLEGEPHCLVLDPADIHFGKLAMLGDTGQEYNIEIARQRVRDGVMGILGKVKGFDIEQIVFVIGNDALHIDNPKRTTTAGTPQDTDKMWHTAFNAAKDAYIEVLSTLVSIAPVRVVYNPSNHDYMSGYMLAQVVHAWFRKSGDITWDIDIRHRKYYRYYNSLMGFSHGDGAKEKDLPSLMPTEATEDYVRSKYKYYYLHHLHHAIGKVIGRTKEHIGLQVEYLKSPSAADRWHQDNGYTSCAGIEAFLHSREGGQCARLTHNF